MAEEIDYESLGSQAPRESILIDRSAVHEAGGSKASWHDGSLGRSGRSQISSLCWLLGSSVHLGESCVLTVAFPRRSRDHHIENQSGSETISCCSRGVDVGWLPRWHHRACSHLPSRQYKGLRAWYMQAFRSLIGSFRYFRSFRIA